MLADPRGKALTQNFVGQWLQVRDLDGIYFNERAILRREGVRLQGADTERNVLTRDVRRAMRSETEMAFEYVVREDRSILELGRLRLHLPQRAGWPSTTGSRASRASEMRRVTLPKDSPRGGVLTHGTDPGGDLEPGPDLAGEAGPVHPRQHPGHARAAAAARHPGPGGRRRRTSRTASRRPAS